MGRPDRHAPRDVSRTITICAPMALQSTERFLQAAEQRRRPGLPPRWRNDGEAFISPLGPPRGQPLPRARNRRRTEFAGIFLRAADLLRAERVLTKGRNLMARCGRHSIRPRIRLRGGNGRRPCHRCRGRCDFRNMSSSTGRSGRRPLQGPVSPPRSWRERSRWPDGSVHGGGRLRKAWGCRNLFASRERSSGRLS